MRFSINSKADLIKNRLGKEINQAAQRNKKLNREELKELLQRLRFSDSEKEVWKWMKGDQKGGVDVENLKVFLAAVMNLKIDGITIVKEKKKEENNVVSNIIKKMKREKSLKHKKIQNKSKISKSFDKSSKLLYNLILPKEKSNCSFLPSGKLLFKSLSAITQTHMQFKTLSDSRYHYLHLMKNPTHTLFYSKNSKYSKIKFAKDDDSVIQSPSPKNKFIRKRRCYSKLKYKANIGKNLIARVPPPKSPINKNKTNESNSVFKAESKIKLTQEESKNKEAKIENYLIEHEDDESVVEFNELSEDLSCNFNERLLMENFDTRKENENIKNKMFKASKNLKIENKKLNERKISIPTESEDSVDKENSLKVPCMYIKILLNSLSYIINVYEGDTAESLSQSFSNEHNFTLKMEEILKDLITEQMKRLKTIDFSIPE